VVGRTRMRQSTAITPCGVAEQWVDVDLGDFRVVGNDLTQLNENVHAPFDVGRR